MLAGSALAAIPAQAQDNDGLYWADRLGNRITVTATRTPTEAEDVPATVTVMTAEDIADQLVTDIKDLVRFEPGVTVARSPARFGAALGSTGRAGNEGFVIRGIGGNRTQILVDGIRVPDGFSFGAQASGRGDYVDLGLVKSVEILRGPASAFYGSDGLAGVVAFTMSEPEDFLKGDASIGGLVRGGYNSDDNEFSETAIVAGRSGDFSAMLAYTRRDFQELDNQGTNDVEGPLRTTPNPQDGNSDSVLGRLVWKPAGGHRISLTGEYTDTYLFTNVLSGRTATVLDLYGEDTGYRARVAADWSWEGEGFVDYAKIGLYWQDAEDRQFTFEDRNPAVDRTRINTFENRVYGASVEARKEFATGSVDHRFVVGGDISFTRQEGLRDGTVPPAGETFPTRAFPATDFTLGGVFIGDQIEFGDGVVTLFPALRFDAYSLDATDDPLLPTFQGADQSDSHISPKFGAVVKVSDEVRLYANYATGFKAPEPSQMNQFFENLAFGYTSLPNPDLGPEKSESWEGGVRFTTDGFSASATAFTANYDDFISQEVVSGSFTPADPAVYQFVNIGKVKVEGLEAKAEGRLRNGLTGRFSIAYAKGDEILPNGDRSPLSTIDPITLVVGLGYREPQGRYGGEVILTQNDSKSLASTQGVCSGTCFRPDASTVIDVTAFFNVTDNLTLRAGIFNITDQKYAYWSDVRGLAASSPITDAYTRPGRNGAASISFRF
ncbi:MAG: TonB-dependent hemoglobin/transferrin/lactoferrin family receptor [Porphyrobacter sp.]|nr:TonB-dependent hemoglobin/transferrin/lactoferrin family receptor [Porphyrobacter sp.]